MTIDLRWVVGIGLLAAPFFIRAVIDGDIRHAMVFLIVAGVVGLIYVAFMALADFFNEPRLFTIGKKGQGDE